MIYDRKIAAAFLNDVLRGYKLQPYSLIPLVCDSYTVWQMTGPGTGIRRLGFFGDIHVNTVMMNVYQNDPQIIGNGTGVFFTLWQNRPTQELAFVNNGAFTGLPTPVHENVLFDNCASYNHQNVDFTGAGGNLWATTLKGQEKPIFQFAGYFFNINQG